MSAGQRPDADADADAGADAAPRPYPPDDAPAEATAMTHSWPIAGTASDGMPHGTLFLVPSPLDFGISATPAGAITDVLPLHTVRAASQLSHWIVENAKTARAVLKRVDAITPLARPLQELHIVEMPRPRKGTAANVPADDIDALLAPALQGHDVGVMSEAGLPAVADPGAQVVHAAHRLGIRVVPLSGPSALMLALAASGLNGQSFAFVGYLPVDAGERVVRVRELEAWSKRWHQTQIVIETPYRNDTLLAALLSCLQPQTALAVSCALTLPQGWTRSDTVSRWKSSPLSLPKDVPAVFCFLG